VLCLLTATSILFINKYKYCVY